MSEPLYGEQYRITKVCISINTDKVLELLLLIDSTVKE